jgi:hypothetical protein
MRAALREETLGERIGERMRSRLQEMCVPVEMRGKDLGVGDQWNKKTRLTTQ